MVGGSVGEACLVSSFSVVGGSGCSFFISSRGEDDSDLDIVVIHESFDAWMLGFGSKVRRGRTKRSMCCRVQMFRRTPGIVRFWMSGAGWSFFRTLLFFFSFFRQFLRPQS